MSWRSLKHLALAAVMALTPFFLSLPMAYASILTSATLEVSTHATSATADHTIQFVTPSGVDASSDTIIVEYDNGFSIGSVDLADIDLAVDDDGACDGPWTDKTLAVSAGVGIWSLVASGGNIMTFTAPTNATTGEIAAGRCVQIEIGTHADGGSDQITNPGSTGSYEVDIYGTFGDHAMYAVGIAGNTGVDVTAIVSSAEGDPGEGGYPPGPSDTTGPVISNVLVSSITTTSALVTWTTDEAASRTLSYGETTSYEIGNLSDASFQTSHSQLLLSLTENTTYNFQILATDGSGNSTTSSNFTFTTLDVTPPTISLEVTNITETTADLEWNTDEPTTSEAGVTPSAYTYTGLTLVTSDVQTATGLTPATTYTAKVEVTDASGNGTTATVQFTTLADLPPGNVTNFNAVGGDGVVALAWTNPTDADFSNVLLVFRTDRFPTSPTDGTVIYSGSGSSTLHTGLTNGQEYFYTIFAVDLGGNLSSGATDSAIPTAPPVIPDDDDDEEEVEEETEEDVEEETEEEETEEDDIDEEEDVEEETEEEEDLPPEPSVLIPQTDVRFLVARDAIELSPRGSTVRVLANRPLAVELDLVNAPEDVISVELITPSGTFLMNPESVITRSTSSSLVEIVNESLYAARVLSPSTDGSLTVRINYVTGEAQILNYVLDVRGDGQVVDEDGNGLADVSLALSTRTGVWSLWNAAAYAQSNPQQSSANGFYAWYVPNGTYRVEATKSDYSTFQSVGIAVGDNIFNAPIELIAVLPPVDEMIEDGVPPVSAVTQQVLQSIKVLRQNPTVQRTSDIATPVVAVTALSTAGILAGALNGLRFLQYLFTAPFLLFRRRRRKRWGVVYDSLRKVPVDLAIVRLLDAQSKRVVKSQVTDKEGRYLFIAKPGTYLIDVRKEGFVFPTSHLSAQKRDGEYLDLYHGEVIDVREADAAVAANIPVDPAGEAVKTPAKLKWERLGRRLMHGVSILGLIVAIVIAAVDPSAWTISVAVVQIVVFLLFVRLAIPSRPKSWGIVYDHRTRRPLTNAIVRIFDPKYNKLLETQVTDSRGRYAFLVGPSQYYTTYEKNGYTKVEVRPIDRTDTKDASYVSVDIGLKQNKRK